MKWFFKWIKKKMVEAANDEDRLYQGSEPMKLTTAFPSMVESKHKIHFTILFAEGGAVLQQEHYNQHQDMHQQKLWLIPEDQDLATRVGEIVALSMYKV